MNTINILRFFKIKKMYVYSFVFNFVFSKLCDLFWQAYRKYPFQKPRDCVRPTSKKIETGMASSLMTTTYKKDFVYHEVGKSFILEKFNQVLLSFVDYIIIYEHNNSVYLAGHEWYNQRNGNSFVNIYKTRALFT